MPISGNVIWRGKPSFASFIGLYILYSTPLLSLLLALLLWRVSPAPVKTVLQVSSSLSEQLVGLPYPYGVVYFMGFLISVVLCTFNWLIRVDPKPMIFALACYATVEVARLLKVFPGDFSIRLFALLAFSLVGVVGVELYRRSFDYYVLRDSIVLKGGFLKRWERIVKKNSISDVVVIRPVLGSILGFVHVVPVTQSQIGLGDTFSLGAVNVGRKSTGVIVGGGKRIVGVEPRPWNCIYGVRDYEKVKRAVLE